MSAVTRTIVAAALAAFCSTNRAYATSLAPAPPCARGLDVPITIYNRSYMSASELDAIVETARSLWRPYGVTLSPVSEHGVAVIVSHGSAEPEGSGQARKILGSTMFSDGHAVPYIRLWVGAAETLLDDSLSPHPWNMPTIERDSLLVPMLGVALAHELGHLLLDTSSHTLDGILQRVIPLRDMEHPTLAHLGLNANQQFALCTAKENRTSSLLK